MRVCMGRRGVVFAATLLFFLLALPAWAEDGNDPLAEEGILDLSGWDFAEQGPASLSGKWEFHWERLLDPGELSGSPSGRAADHFTVPAIWEGKTAQGKELSGKGFATYRLRVILPETPPSSLALIVSGALSTCRVWINGELEAATGRPGRNPDAERPEHHYAVAHFAPFSRTLDIVIQVSNFNNVQGGLSRTIQLGPEHLVDHLLLVQWAFGAFIAGALVCMSLYHFTLFLLRRKALPNLYIGLFCLFWSVATAFNPASGFLMDAVGAGIPWGWYINLSILPYGLTIPLLLIFYHSLFPKRSGPWVNGFFLFLGLAFMAYILITPGNAYDPAAFFYFLVTRVAFLYLFAMFALDVARGERGTLLLAPGYLGLAYAEFDEMLFDMNIVGSPDFGPYGILLFILAYSFFLSSRFARAYSKVERLSTDLEATNVRLMRLNELKDDFLANTAHELKTPLSGMVGIAESLLAGAGGRLSDAARDHLLVVAHSGKRLAGLVNDVLDLSRLQHHDIVLRRRAVDLDAAVRSVLALSRGLAADRGLVLENRIPDGFPAIMADRDRLEQILFNLVGNSLKFTDQGSVTVSASIQGELAEVSVTDTGEGIPAEDQERIFSAYEQVEKARPRFPGGTGLGLAISRRLAELHGASMRVESRPGEGARFSFTLPLAGEGAEPGDSPAGTGPDAPGAEEVEKRALSPLPSCVLAREASGRDDGRVQVLVVDDEPVNLHVVTSCLELAQITCRTAHDGARALELLEQGDDPDMILLDVMMPGPDGYEVCREIRRTHSASELPVVMLTVRNRVEDVVQGFAAGANDYLTKPFSREELLARVGTQLKLKKTYDILAENVRLKTELNRRRKTEQRLRLMQHRLSRMLDSLDDAIVAVNQSMEICFSNKAFAELTGYSPNSLLGRPFPMLVEDTGQEDSGLVDALASTADSPDQAWTFEGIVLARAGAEGMSTTLFVTSMELEEELLRLVVVRRADDRDGRQAALLSAAMLGELNNNRQRILNLEEALFSLESTTEEDRLDVLEDLKALDGLLQRLGDRLSRGDRTEAKRELAVSVMNLAVECWSTFTGTTKAELAEQSRTWNVYLEKDGYCRTQTLDKYLNLGTLPKRPRWRDIHATAEFVLANTDPDLPLHQNLARTLARLKDLL